MKNAHNIVRTKRKFGLFIGIGEDMGRVGVDYKNINENRKMKYIDFVEKRVEKYKKAIQCRE